MFITIKIIIVYISFFIFGRRGDILPPLVGGIIA